MSENSENILTRADDPIVLVDHQKARAVQEIMFENLELYREAIKHEKLRVLRILARRQIISGDYDTDEMRYSEIVRKNTKYRFVTISLDCEKMTISEWVNKVNKVISSRKFILKGSRWVFEQRSEQEETAGEGLHVHLLMPSTKKYPNEIIRDLANPLGIKDNFIHIFTPDNVENPLSYLTGDKKDKSKHRKQEIDKYMRDKYKIQSVYEK